MLMTVIRIVLCIATMAMIMLGRKLIYAKEEGEVSKKSLKRNENQTVISFVLAVIFAILLIITLFINMHALNMPIMIMFTLSICFIGKYFPQKPDIYSIGIAFMCMTIFFVVAPKQ